MDSVLRALAIYAFLMVVLRLGGKRTFSQMTAFDFVLLLIISEATQQALLGNDFSLVNAFLVIITLVAADVGMSLLKQRFGILDKIADDVPVLLIADGCIRRDCLERERVDEADILTAARRDHGLERLDQIKYAVLERSGGITVVPKRSEPRS